MPNSFFNFKPETQFVSFLRAPIITSFVISSIICIVSILYYFNAQPVLPLFYSLARPAQHLAPKMMLFILPAISLLMSVLHTIVVQIFKEYSPVILKLFVWVTVVLQLVLLFIFLRIVIITI